MLNTFRRTILYVRDFVSTHNFAWVLAVCGKLGHTDSLSDSDNEFEYVSAPKNLRGVARAQKAFLEERRGIYKRNDDITELMIRREGCSSAMRLVVCKLEIIWLS